MEHARIGSEELFMEMKGGKGYTTADIEALPEGERAELIDGEMFMMEAPTWTHQDILVKLLFEIELYIRKNRGKCKVLPAPFGNIGLLILKKKQLPYMKRIIGMPLCAILFPNRLRWGFMKTYT